MKQNQKGFSPLIILVIIAIIVVLLVLANKGTNIFPVGQIIPTIQDRNGLDAAAKDLNSADPNQVDSELNQLNTEASGF